MAVQAAWHTLSWGYSPARVISVESFSTGRSVSVERNADKEGEPATQTVAFDLQTLSFSYTLNATAGCSPYSEYNDARACLGIHAPFYLGGKRFPADEMLLKSVNTKDWVFGARGEAISVTVDVEFEEYAEDASGLKTEKGNATSLRPGMSSPAPSSALNVGPTQAQRLSMLSSNDQMRRWQR